MIANILRGYAQESAIGPACFAHKLLGRISVKVRIKNVIIPVDIPIARASSIPETRAISIAIFVASDAVRVLRRLLPISIVISTLSVLFFNFCNVSAQSLFFFTNASITWLGRDIIAISEPEKKAEANNRKTNKSIVTKSIRI